MQKASPVTDAAGETLGGMLARAVQIYRVLLDKELGAIKATLGQWRVLSAISAHGPCTQTKAVESSGVDRSTAADIVKRLVASGYLTRKRTKDDARAYAVKLTAAGEVLFARLRKAAREADAKLLGLKLDRAELAAVLGEIITAHAGIEGGA